MLVSALIPSLAPLGESAIALVAAGDGLGASEKLGRGQSK
jgi:hypothetical protein